MQILLLMECFSYLVGIFHGALASQQSTTDNVKGGCGYNLQFRDGNCTTCSPGWFGIGCSQTCPPGYYGTLCNEKCDCTETVEICKHDVGCTSITRENTENQATVSSRDRQSRNDYIYIYLAVGASSFIVLGVFVMSIFIGLKKTVTYANNDRRYEPHTSNAPMTFDSEEGNGHYEMAGYDQEIGDQQTLREICQPFSSKDVLPRTIIEPICTSCNGTLQRPNAVLRVHSSLDIETDENKYSTLIEQSYRDGEDHIYDVFS